MKRLKGDQKELSSFFQTSSRFFHRRRNYYYHLQENTTSKPAVRSYNRSRVPRLRWTNQLHQCFVNAVQELGGEQKATPKMILPKMNVKGLTLSHIKSHLQMFRSMKNDVILQEAKETKQAENHLCFAQQKNYHKHTMHSGVHGSETSRTTVSRKKELTFISNEVNDDTENARAPFGASLSSSSVVDIELTLGGPYACLKSCESDKNASV